MPPLKFVIRLGNLVANQTGLQIFSRFRVKPFDDSFQEDVAYVVSPHALPYFE